MPDPPFPSLPGPTVTTKKKSKKKKSRGRTAAEKAFLAGQVPRPPNCFMLYRKEKQPQILQSLGPDSNINSKDVSPLLAKMWRDEPEEVRQHYRREADRLKKEHLVKYPEFKFKAWKASNAKKAAQEAQEAANAAVPVAPPSTSRAKGRKKRSPSAESEDGSVTGYYPSPANSVHGGDVEDDDDVDIIQKIEQLAQLGANADLKALAPAEPQPAPVTTAASADFSLSPLSQDLIAEICALPESTLSLIDPLNGTTSTLNDLRSGSAQQSFPLFANPSTTVDLQLNLQILFGGLPNSTAPAPAVSQQATLDFSVHNIPGADALHMFPELLRQITSMDAGMPLADLTATATMAAAPTPPPAKLMDIDNDAALQPLNGAATTTTPFSGFEMQAQTSFKVPTITYQQPASATSAPATKPQKKRS
ncbi:hypothetical protein HDU96_004703, partial [Phlyctochytrium bullatum]